MTVPISADQLIDIIYRDVFKAAVDDCESVLERPPGRNPGQAALDASSWYAGLSSGDREMLHSAIQKAADFAVFGMLCLLDNVRPIAEGFSQELRLSVEASGERFDFDQNDPLHTIFRARVVAESEAANELSFRTAGRYEDTPFPPEQGRPTQANAAVRSSVGKVVYGGVVRVATAMSR
jgi:hypothetical protein